MRHTILNESTKGAASPGRYDSKGTVERTRCSRWFCDVLELLQESTRVGLGGNPYTPGRCPRVPYVSWRYESAAMNPCPPGPPRQLRYACVPRHTTKRGHTRQKMNYYHRIICLVAFLWWPETCTTRTGSVCMCNNCSIADIMIVSLTIFCHVHGVSQVFASGNVPDIVSTTHSIDVDVLIRSESLLLCVRTVCAHKHRGKLSQQHVLALTVRCKCRVDAAHHFSPLLLIPLYHAGERASYSLLTLGPTIKRYAGVLRQPSAA